jgi:hypothetical protein
VPDHFPQFDEKFVRLQQLAHHQAAVGWGLNPPTGEHDGFKRVLNEADGKLGMLPSGGF